MFISIPDWNGRLDGMRSQCQGSSSTLNTTRWWKWTIVSLWSWPNAFKREPKIYISALITTTSQTKHLEYWIQKVVCRQDNLYLNLKAICMPTQDQHELAVSIQIELWDCVRSAEGQTCASFKCNAMCLPRMQSIMKIPLFRWPFMETQM